MLTKQFKNKEWELEKTDTLQIESLIRFAKVLNYNLRVINCPAKGFEAMNSKNNTVNFISFIDMINLHNFMTKERYENKKKNKTINGINLDIGFIISPKSLKKELKIKNKSIFNDNILFIKLINYSYQSKLVEKIKLQKNKNHLNKIEVMSHIVELTKNGNEYLKETDYKLRKDDVIIEIDNKDQNIIKEIEIYRDKNSFSFEYKKVKYEILAPLYMLTSNDKVIDDIVIIQNICDNFDYELLKNEKMKTRIKELFKYLKMLKAIKKGHL